MKIVFFDLAGKDFPGGCEKYFANLSRFFASSNSVTFFQSRSWFRLLEHIYVFINGHKVNSIKYLQRETGKVLVKEIPLTAFLPWTKSYRDVKTRFQQADIIYTKNEFQELAFLYYWIGKKGFAQK